MNGLTPHQKDELDRHITGNWGEDQFQEDEPDFLFLNAMSTMWRSISKAALACVLARSGKHRFSGYPRSSARCRSCGTPLFRM